MHDLQLVFQFFSATLFNPFNSTFEQKTANVSDEITKLVTGDSSTKLHFNQSLTYGEVRKAIERITSFRAIQNVSPTHLVSLSLMFPQGQTQAQSFVQTSVPKSTVSTFQHA
jgi:hypothetical protein